MFTVRDFTVPRRNRLVIKAKVRQIALQSSVFSVRTNIKSSRLERKISKAIVISFLEILSLLSQKQETNLYSDKACPNPNYLTSRAGTSAFTSTSSSLLGFIRPLPPLPLYYTRQTSYSHVSHYPFWRRRRIHSYLGLALNLDSSSSCKCSKGAFTNDVSREGEGVTQFLTKGREGVWIWY